MATEAGLNAEIGITLGKLQKQLSQAEARMAATAKKMESRFGGANKAISQGFANTNRATNTFAKGGMRNVSMQLSQVAQQGAATGNYMKALAIQLPDLALAFGPLGIIIGAVAGSLLTFGIGMFSAGEKAKELKGIMDGLSKAIADYESATKRASEPTVNLLDQFGEFSERAQQLLNLQRQLAFLDSAAALNEASTALADMFGTLQFGAIYSDDVAADLERIYEAVNGINPRAVMAIAEELSISKQDAQILAEQLAALQNAKGPEELAAAWRNVNEQFELAATRNGEMSKEARETFASMLLAEEAAVKLANVDIASGIGAGADEAGRLAGNLSFAARQAAALRSAQMQLAAGSKEYGGRGGDPRKSNSLGYGEFKYDGPQLDANNNVIPKKAGGGGSKKDKEPFFEDAQQQQDKLRQQIDLIGETKAKIAELSVKWALLSEAKERGLNLDARIAGTGETLRQQIDAQATSIGNLTAEYERATERAEFMDQAQQDLKDGFLDAIVAGGDLSDVLRDLAQQFAKAAAEAALFGTGPFASSAGGGGLLSGLLGGLFGGARAAGGPVRGGRSYLVGEEGPELFTPGGSGSIMSAPKTSMLASQAGGGGGTTDVRVWVDDSGKLQATIERTAGRVSAQVVKSNLRDYDRHALPLRVSQINADPRARG